MSSFASTTALLVLLAAICVLFPINTQGASFLVGCSSALNGSRTINSTIGGVVFVNNGTRGTMLPAQGTPAQRAAAQRAFQRAVLSSLLNPANIFSPLNPLNPIGLLNPNSPFSALNPFNVLNPLNPNNPINVLGRSLYQLALLSREPIVTPPNNGQPILAGEPFVASFLLRDIAALNIPGAKIRITIRGNIQNLQFNCSNPAACILTGLNTTTVDGVTVVEFPLLAPGIIPLTIFVSGVVIEDITIPSNQRGGPIGRVSITVEIIVPINTVVASQTAVLNIIVKYCRPGGLSDGQCGNRCHNNKRRCNRDPGCKWFTRSYSCVRRKANTRKNN
jgi:hypothetical protein